jgi:hypothetical protein
MQIYMKESASDDSRSFLSMSLNNLIVSLAEAYIASCPTLEFALKAYAYYYGFSFSFLH